MKKIWFLCIIVIMSLTISKYTSAAILDIYDIDIATVYRIGYNPIGTFSFTPDNSTGTGLSCSVNQGYVLGYEPVIKVSPNFIAGCGFELQLGAPLSDGDTLSGFSMYISGYYYPRTYDDSTIYFLGRLGSFSFDYYRDGFTSDIGGPIMGLYFGMGLGVRLLSDPEICLEAIYSANSGSRHYQGYSSPSSYDFTANISYSKITIAVVLVTNWHKWGY